MKTIIDQEKKPAARTTGSYMKTLDLPKIAMTRGQVNPVTDLAPMIRRTFADLWNNLERQAHHGR